VRSCRRILPGYLVALGMVSGLLAAAVGSTTAEMIPKSQKGWQVEVVRRICRWASLIGIVGLIGMVIASGNGAALNDAP
jgi:MFS family permease